jgi:CDP-diglyceride synthetase
MSKTIIKSVILFLSIPLINSIAFGIGTIFHEMHQSIITQEQFQSYQVSMIIMIVVLIISIPLLELLYSYSKITNQTAILLYLGVLSTIAVLTFDQFSFRPYEHGLTFLSVASLLLTRELLNKKLMPSPMVKLI